MSSTRPILLIPCKNKRKTFRKQAIKEIIQLLAQKNICRVGFVDAPQEGVCPRPRTAACLSTGAGSPARASGNTPCGGGKEGWGEGMAYLLLYKERMSKYKMTHPPKNSS